MSHFDDILQGLQNGHDTDSIYLDYAKAFDKVDHKLLLKKLKIYGLLPKLTAWIASFLEDLPQTIVVNGIKSYVAKVLSGVPQGTILGPIPFILFINGTGICVKHSIMQFFANDTRISKEIKSEADSVKLQEDLNSVIAWSLQNNMMLHEDKFELIVHKAGKLEIEPLPFATFLKVPSYTVPSGKRLYPVDSLKDLGVIVSPDLSWTPHVSTIAARARSVASWVLGVFRT